MQDILLPAVFLQHKDLAIIDALILAYIKTNMNEDCLFFEDDKEISKTLKVNVAAVPTILEKLFKLGFIERSHDSGKRVLTYCFDAPHKLTKSGYVYIMKDETHPYLKIGYSNDPKYREHTLQGDKPTVTLLAKWKGTMADEQTCHRILAKYRKRGEWFEVSYELAEATIKKVLGII